MMTDTDYFLLAAAAVVPAILVILLFRARIAHVRKAHAREIEDLRGQSSAALTAIEQAVEEEKQLYRNEVERARDHYQAEAHGIFLEMSAALEELQGKLVRYAELESLADDEAGVRATLAQALQEAEELRQAATRMLEETRQSAAAERAVAIERARKIQVQAEAMLARVTLREAEIVRDAERKAEEIGGDAYRALREKEHLEEAVKAVRNVIEGYGDRYVRPTLSLLDDLAADFSHTEAGAALATARQRARAMVDQGLAAECDYVEKRRKDTAIRFVVDAFNGRVDTILGRVKHDNHGTLQQEIQDAFRLVNLNGEAFRNARISEAYLDARLSELKWAVVAQELKLQEREEQRAIREQIREEERARRDYERAMKQAQREEALILQALEKVRREADSASEEQREHFQKQMAELADRLAEAEARNQRALSMAQQTKKGNVYIISNIGSFGEEVFKIGMTRRLEPLDRVKELGDASVPFEFDVHAIIPSDDAPALESELHSVFNDLRLNQVNRRKEFFRVPLERIRDFVRERKIDCTFTMVAEAHAFRESQALLKMGAEERARYQPSTSGSSAGSSAFAAAS